MSAATAQAKTFKIRGADGDTIEIQPGEFYVNTKDRCRRLMSNGLSAGARQVYACLEMYTMGFRREDAATMEGGKLRHIRPSDIVTATAYSKNEVRRYLEELEDAGLAKREEIGGGDLSTAKKGRVRILAWAHPREKQPNKTKDLPKKGDARVPLPAWFPGEWGALAAYLKRKKMQVTISEGDARVLLLRGKEVARILQEAEMGAARFVKEICARPPEGAPTSTKDEGSVPPKERTESIERKEAAAAAFITPEKPAAAAPPDPSPEPPKPERRVGCILCPELAEPDSSLCASHLAQAKAEYDDPGTPTPPSIEPILEAFAPYGGLSDSRARRLLLNCGDAAAEEVAARAGEIAAGVRGPNKNVAGILWNQLPEFFAGREGVAKWRRGRAAPGPVTPGPTEEELRVMEESERELRRKLAEPVPKRGDTS